MTRLGSS